jgi:uncharacterized protein (DUF952 family)
LATILHITPRQAWERAVKAGSYTADSLGRQGFIHCSTGEQVLSVADCIFAGRQGLVLLCIQEDLLAAEVKYENLEGGAKLFPHVYGPINLEAVRDVLDFHPSSDGTFELPGALKNLGGIDAT